MSYSKKFYDAALPDSGGGADTEVLEQPNSTETKETVAPAQSIASLMAKQGVKTTNDNKAAKPVVNTENKEEPKQAQKETVATTTTSNAETANPESLPPTDEKKEAETKPIAQTATTNQTWQEVLKSQQPNNVLKELGFDDKTVQVIQDLNKFEKKDFFYNLFNEWKSKGDLKSYLNELSTDYGKMSPEQVMRHQLAEEYGTDNQKTLDALFKNKIIKAYNLDSDDPDEVEEGQLLLEAEANKYRPKLIERQQSKLFPQVPDAPPIEPDNSEQEAQKNFETYKSTVNTDPYFQKVADKKQITIGKGEDKFNFPVDPDAIKNVLFDTDKWAETQFEKVLNTDGTFKYNPKVQNQTLTAAVALYGQQLFDAYAQHYITVGSKKAIEPIQNAKPPELNTVPNTVFTPKNAAEAMAKAGKKIAGGV